MPVCVEDDDDDDGGNEEAENRWLAAATAAPDSYVNPQNLCSASKHLFHLLFRIPHFTLSSLLRFVRSLKDKQVAGSEPRSRQRLESEKRGGQECANVSKR